VLEWLPVAKKRLHEHNRTSIAGSGSRRRFKSRVFTKLAFYCVHGTACNIEVGP